MILILHAQLLEMHAQTLMPSKHSQATESQEVTDFKSAEKETGTEQTITIKIGRE